MSQNGNNRGRKLPGKADHKSLEQMIGGKIPPQARELEETIIGTMIMHPKESVFDTKMILKPKDFYVPGHVTIVKTIYEMEEAGEPIDLMTLPEKLKTKGQLEEVGGAFTLVKYTNSVVNFAEHNLKKWILIIKQYSMARQMIHFSLDVLEKAYSDDIFDTLDYAEKLMFELSEDFKINTIKDFSQVLFETAQDVLEEVSEEDFVQTGFPEWDKLNGRLLGQLYVVAGRPGMGKTSFAVELLGRMSEKFPTAFVNGEMTDKQLSKRLIANKVTFHTHVFKLPKAHWDDRHFKHFHQGLQAAVNLKIFLYSQSNDVTQVVAYLRYLKKKFGIKCAIIDFLQILTVPEEMGKYMTDTQRLNYILGILRTTAKDLDLPIILLSQLNREVTKRSGEKRPILSDLKGSGAIEEYAYQISFLHRPEYYAEEGAVADEMGESIKGLMYQFIQKHRDGELADLKHRFIPEYMQIKEWESLLPTFSPMDTDPF